MRFAPEGEDFLDVCPLCQDDRSRVRLGQGRQPDDADASTRSRASGRFSLGAFLDPRRAAPDDSLAPEPILRRLSDQSARWSRRPSSSTRARTAEPSAGSARASASRDASVVPALGREHAEVVVTVAWDISWYQYRVLPESAQPGPARRARPRAARSSSRRSGPGTRASRPTAGSFRRSHASRTVSTTKTVIYCVIPRELEAELFDKMVEYYKDNPNVTVIVDRRTGPDRRKRGGRPGGKRELRDRRRPRIPARSSRPRPEAS